MMKELNLNLKEFNICISYQVPLSTLNTSLINIKNKLLIKRNGVEAVTQTTKTARRGLRIRV